VVGAGDWLQRSSIADPDFVTKLRQGRFDEIRPFSLALLREAIDRYDSTLGFVDTGVAEDTES
jgi:hypothetical protein